MREKKPKKINIEPPMEKIEENSKESLISSFISSSDSASSTDSEAERPT